MEGEKFSSSFFSFKETKTKQQSNRGDVQYLVWALAKDRGMTAAPPLWWTTEQHKGG